MYFRWTLRHHPRDKKGRKSGRPPKYEPNVKIQATDYPSRLSSPPQWCWTCQRSLAAWPGPRSLLDDHCRTTHDAHFVLCAGRILKGNFYILSAIPAVHECTIFLCSLEIGNIHDQCRRPSIQEKDHLAGWLTTSTEPTITKPKHIFQWSVQNMSKYWEECMLILIPNGISNSWALFCDPWSWVCPWTCPCLCLPWMSKNKGCWCIISFDQTLTRYIFCQSETKLSHNHLHLSRF